MSSFLYYETILTILDRAFQEQKETLHKAALMMADVISSGNLIYVFGAGHAAIIAEEMFYRAGGLVPVNPIFAPGLITSTHPATLETALERLTGYAALLFEAHQITPDDLLIIHSNSGRNTVAIELAEITRSRGVKVIALTSIAHSQAFPSRHPKGLRLMDVADLVLDNCGVVGDAAVELPGLPQRVGATSTVVGAALMNAVVVETIRILLERGQRPPIFCSANVDGGEAMNEYWLQHYRNKLTYL